MSEPNNIDIHSQTIDKAINVLEESTTETRKTLDKGMSNILKKFGLLLSSTPLGIKLDSYIAERPYKLQKEMERIEAKYNKIPEQDRIEPSSTIAINVAKEMNYYLDEDYIKEMFENILISDMNNQKKKLVSPAYIDIVKQLTKDDANFLKIISEYKNNCFPIIELIVNNPDGSYNIISKKIICSSENECIVIEPIVFDNISRFNFLNLTFSESLSNERRYEKIFENIKNDFQEISKIDLQELSKINFDEISKINLHEISKMKLDIKKGILTITEFGQRFIDICIK